MTPTMKAALRQRQVRIAGLIRIDLPDHTAFLSDGGTVPFDGANYRSSDSLLGSIDKIETIAEAVGDLAPGLDLTMAPPAARQTVEVAFAGMQGSRKRAWLAVVDAETGQVVPDPELLFDGEIDVAIPINGVGSRRIRYEVASVFERLLAPDEGARMSDAYHQSIFPGETGFSQMTGTTRDPIWGPGNRPPVATRV